MEHDDVRHVAVVERDPAEALVRRRGVVAQEGGERPGESVTRPGKPSCSGETPNGIAGATSASTRGATRSQTAVADRVGAEWRVAPCCSVEPTGTSTRGLARAARDLDDVRWASARASTRRSVRDHVDLHQQLGEPEICDLNLRAHGQPVRAEQPRRTAVSAEAWRMSLRKIVILTMSVTSQPADGRSARCSSSTARPARRDPRCRRCCSPRRARSARRRTRCRRRRSRA